MVPMLERAVDIVEQADVVLVIGTSLQVYPANGLVNEAPRKAPIYLIDPNPNTGFVRKQVIAIKEKAGEGVPKVVAELLENTKTHRKMTAPFKQIATSVAIYHFSLCLSICIISLISVSFCFGSDSATNKVSAASPVSLITGYPL